MACPHSRAEVDVVDGPLPATRGAKIFYWGPFLFSASIPALYYGLGGCSPFATVALLLVALIGAEWLSPRGGTGAQDPGRHPRFLPVAYIPCQLAIVVWALLIVSNPLMWTPVYLSLIVSVGVTTGVFGVLAAHEMAHSPGRVHRALGTAMLTAMSYRQFRIAHIYGHHRWAGTELDAATARLGEGFYAFLLRTVAGQLVEAWRFEERRRAARGSPLIANRTLQDGIVGALLFALVFAVLGWRSAVFLAGESVVAVVVLELFNYIAHYGLLRERRSDGRREPLDSRHSWNSSNIAANMLIFNMGRHSDHHRAPSAPYGSLSYIAAAPELPAGYAGSILLALVPPLWRRVMDPEVARLRARSPLGSRLVA